MTPIPSFDPISLGLNAVGLISGILGGRSKRKQAKENAKMARNEARYNAQLTRVNAQAKSDDLLFQKRVSQRNKVQLLRQGGRASKNLNRAIRAQDATTRVKTGYRGGTFSNVMKSQEVQSQEKVRELQEQVSDASLQATTGENLMARRARLTRLFGEQQSKGILFAGQNKAAGLNAEGKQAQFQSNMSALGSGLNMLDDIKPLGDKNKFFS